MDATRTSEPLSRPMTVFWAALAVFWIYSLSRNVHALWLGTPDTYHREHTSGALLAGASLLLALSFLVRRLAIRGALIAGSMSLLVVQAVVSSRP